MPNINFKEILDKALSDAKAALLDITAGSSAQVQEAAKNYLSRLPVRLKDNLEYMEENPSDLQFLKDRFKDEEKILENELLSFAVIGAGIAQNIINAIQGILIKAVFAVLPVA